MAYLPPARSRTFAEFVIVIITVLLAGHGVVAQQGQQGQTLTVGDSVTGTISDNVYQVAYGLSIAAASPMTFSMISDDTLASHVILQDSTGKTLAESDNSSGGRDAYLQYNFSQTGQYTVIATRYGGQNGPTIGGYRLSVQAGRTAPTATPTATVTMTPTGTITPTQSPTREPTITPSHTLFPSPTPVDFVEGGDIVPGDVMNGTIDGSQFAYMYTFQGELGQQLTVTMNGEDSLQPSLYLLNGNQPNTLETAVAKPGESSVVLDYVLPENGEFAILATRDKKAQGTTSGPFTLTLQAASSVKQISIAGTPDKIVAGLLAKGLVPKGGKLLFTLPAGIALQESKSGNTNLTLGASIAAQEFVSNFQVALGTQGDRFGCGIAFWQAGSQDYATAWFTRQGRASLLQMQGGDLVMRFSQQNVKFTPKGISTVTVIAAQDKVAMYIDGALAAIAKGYPVKGALVADLYNPPGNSDLTSCSFTKGWVWTFDK